MGFDKKLCAWYFNISHPHLTMTCTPRLAILSQCLSLSDCEFVWMFEIGCISTLNLPEVGLDIVELPLPWDFVEVPKSRFSWSSKVLY